MIGLNLREFHIMVVAKLGEAKGKYGVDLYISGHAEIGAPAVASLQANPDVRDSTPDPVHQEAHARYAGDELPGAGGL